MMRSMFAGVSGLRSHQLMMDVVGNNIANINTTGFKGSRVVFQDTLSQVLRGGTAATADQGGVNPQQVGLGVRVAGVDVVATQGPIQNTGRPTDVAIQGDGYFAVRNGGEELYTRAGSFSFDNAGNLADPTGAIVQGWVADAAGVVSSNGPVGDIKLPLGQSIAPEPTRAVRLGGNLSSEAVVPTEENPSTSGKVSTAITVIDPLGVERRVSFDYTKTENNAWTLSVKDEAGEALASFDLTFDEATGALTPMTEELSVTLPAKDGAQAHTFVIELGETGEANALTQFGGKSTAAAIGQDGAPTGYLRSFSIADDGTIGGVFSNGRSKTLGQLAVASFTNPAGLVKAGGSQMRAAAASGAPSIGVPGGEGRGSLAAGALEGSNVDLAQEFTNLMIAQRGFQANSRIISTSDDLLQELVNLKR